MVVYWQWCQKDLSSSCSDARQLPRTNLLFAIQHWQEKEADLQALSDQLNAGRLMDAFDFEPMACHAPLPRSPQWLDASAFLNHGRLMEEAFNSPPIADFDTIPVMYQGASDDFQGPAMDIPMPNEADGIDFEARIWCAGHFEKYLCLRLAEETARAISLDCPD
ncbi:hypothetical protein P4S72_05990 [Vibrio sp. PP-XX7]